MSSVNTRTGFFLKSAVVVCFALLFFTQNLSAQVISNNGAAISLTPGVVVNTDTVANQSGFITNNGILNLSGDYINAATTSGNGFFNLAGDWINTGIFNPDASTVQFNGSNNQTITKAGGESFYNLVINNSGAASNNHIVLPQQVTVSNRLTLTLGNIDPGVNTLFLTNPASSALNYTSVTGSRVLGKFERGINSIDNYLFPIGSTNNYNPLNLKPNTLPVAGSILSEFLSTDPGISGLPLIDAGTPLSQDSVEVDTAYADGYWNLKANGFSSADYNINLNGSGFISPIQDITRIIKRPAGGDWLLDGTHSDAIVPVTYRNNLTSNISGAGTDFALGHVIPHIRIHPQDTAVCDGESATFSVVATGRNPLYYQWQEFIGFGGWNNLSDGGIYSGTHNDTLMLSPTNLSMNGYRYRVIVTDANGNFKISNSSATLTVNPNPVAAATPQTDTICNNETTYIELTSDVPGTTFEIEVLHTGPITGATTALTGGNTIQQTLTNPTNAYDYVEYLVIPKGPFSTYCIGTTVTVRIYVNPTPIVLATVFNDTICNDTYDRITLKSTSTFTTGLVTFDYFSIPTGGVTGNSSGLNLTNQYVFLDSLHNPTGLPGPPATPQTVTYYITPRIVALGCTNGPQVSAMVTVHPTPDTYFEYGVNNEFTEDSVTCYLDSDGYATLVAQNGINIFTYAWDDPLNQTSFYADNLPIGVHTVTVTDNQGCTTTDSIEIKQPFRLTPYIDSLKYVTCYGYSDGYINVIPSGGNGGYSYLWETGETTSYAENLSGDIYDLTITDYKGCARDTSIFIYEPATVSVGLNEMQNVICYGENNGFLDVNAVNATSYYWIETGETTSRIENLSEGNYNVVVTINDDCEAYGSYNITEPDSLMANSVSTSISCAGDADGTIDLSITGGNIDQPYQYLWSNGETTEDLSGLSGGTYIVTVTDHLGCMVNETAIVNEPPPFWSTISHTDVTCYGYQDGAIDLTSEGGNGTHRYLWSNGNTSEDISNLNPGIYSVTVYDEKDCEINNSDTVLEPEELLSNISKTDISCFGNADGTAKVNISGGNGGYSILWSNSQIIDSIFNLSNGIYSVNIEDVKGCFSSNSVEITEPEKIEPNWQKLNITCFGYQNGEISLSPTGGIQPYNYTWSHDALFTGNIATSLEPGSYNVSVTDNNNCSQTVDIEISQPDPLIANITKDDVTCFGYHDGYISINMYGGTPEYTYQWENGIFEPSASMLGEGAYVIHIFDTQNCLVDTIIDIIEPEALTINPEIIESSCPDIQNGSVALNINGGFGYYNILWSNGLTVDNINNIRSGKYEIIIQDENSCELKTLITVPSASENCLEIPNAFTPNNDGVNDLWSISGIEELYPDADIEVFDRRGTRVFYSRGYNTSKYWDGTYNGKELPMDSYYYIIYLKNGLSRISGTVTIIR